MALKIKFDKDRNPIEPTFVLAHRSGDKIGVITNKSKVNVSVDTKATEFSFNVPKFIDGQLNPLWEDLKDLRLIWCKEWDCWFEISVELIDSNEIYKTISGTALCESELSQTVVYGIEINTETDISRDDYTIPTTIYNELNTKASLLHRLFEKLPHYTIKHVDTSLIDLQRTFTFDNKTIVECLNEIAEEIKAVVIYDNGTKTENGKRIPSRSVSFYDAQCYCQTCGNRDESFVVCPKCNGTLVKSGYGNDTTIFISKENLTDDITFTNNVDNVKNCFNLEGGDDLMTATIMNCNPNGSQYIWNITEDMKEDMPKDLVSAINLYENQYSYYQNEYICINANREKSAYNLLVDKYESYNSDLQNIDSQIVGFPMLMNTIYDTIDFELFLTSGLMPTVEISEITAEIEIRKVNTLHLSSVAVTKLSTASKSTVNSVVLAAAKTLVNSIYKVEIVESDYNAVSHYWRGSIKVTNYSDEEDTASTNTLTISVSDNYESYLKQKIDIAISKVDNEVYTMSTILKIEDLDTFKSEIQKYSLNALQTIYDCCQGCMDVLVEQGIADKETWANSDPDLYTVLYLAYFNKLNALQSEINVRESEIKTIQTYAEAAELDRKTIQNALNFSRFLGSDLWKIFCSYRRDETYKNSNYISDGLSNSELFNMALQFIDVATKEIVKASIPETTIKAKLKNLLMIPEFEKLLDSFELYNWLRIKVDGKIYKLRLLKYDIDFEDSAELEVEFSNVQYINTTVSDLSDILSRAQAMSSTFPYVERQAEKGRSSYLQYERWRQDGLDATLTKIVNNAENQDIQIDNHGLLARRYDDILGSYIPTQLKLVNSTLAITNDNWETIKTAIGNFIYKNPETGEYENAYGINGEVIVGNLIIGEELGIYSENSKLKFDKDGLNITNNVNTFKVDPNSNRLLVLSNEDNDLISVSATGELHIKGDGDIQSLNYATYQSGGGVSNGIRIDLSNNPGIYTKNFTLDSDGNATMSSVTINSGIIRSASYQSSQHRAGMQINLNEGGIDSPNFKVSSSGSVTIGDGVIMASNYDENVNGIATSGMKIDLSGTNDYLINHANFRVTTEGDVILNNATFTGGVIQSSNYVANTSGMKINLSTGAISTANFKLSETGIATVTGIIMRSGTIEPYSYSASGGQVGLSIDVGAGTVTSKNFKLSSSGEATLSGVTITSGVIKSSNYAESSSGVATAGMQIDLTNKTIKTPNFSLSNTGVMTATSATLTSATVTGSVTSTSGNYKTAVTSGQLNFYYNNNSVGTIYAALTDSTYYRTAFLSGSGRDGIMLGERETSGTITGYYFLNLNNGYNQFDARHYFKGTVRFGNDIKVGGTCLTSINFNDNYGLKWGNNTGLRYANSGVSETGFYVGITANSCNTILVGGAIKLKAHSYFSSGATFDSAVTFNSGATFDSNLKINDSKRLTIGNEQGIYCGDNCAFAWKNSYAAVCVGIDTADLRLFGSNVYLGSGSTTVSSDERKKNTIENLDSRYIELMKKITPYSFKYNSDVSKSGRKHTGFIAQNVLSILQDSGIDTTEFAGFVDMFNDGKEYALRYEEFISPMLLYIQSLDKENQSLKQQLNSLQSDLLLIKEKIGV